jgi:hypothetical protein
MTKVPRTPKGLAYLTEWGANRYAANAALTALVAADLGIKTDQYRRWAIQQVRDGEYVTSMHARLRG